MAVSAKPMAKKPSAMAAPASILRRAPVMVTAAPEGSCRLPGRIRLPIAFAENRLELDAEAVKLAAARLGKV